METRGTVLDYIVWKIDSDNIAGDLTKEGSRRTWKDGAEEIHPARSFGVLSWRSRYTQARVCRDVRAEADVGGSSQPQRTPLLPQDEFM